MYLFGCNKVMVENLFWEFLLDVAYIWPVEIVLNKPFK